MTQTITEKETENLEAIIEHQGDEKYIVGRVSKDGNEKYVLVSLPLEYHSGITRAYKQRLNGEYLEVLGGGILEINPTEKTIRTYGMSGSYGQPDRDLVEKILRKNYKGYDLDVKVTNYVRG